MNKYERMKIICLFDLPTDTNDEKREYREFRKELISSGFYMMQFSVYVRTCPNREFAKKYVPRLKKISPRSGNIRVLMITEKQFQDMELILGKLKNSEEIIGINKIVVI